MKKILLPLVVAVMVLVQPSRAQTLGQIVEYPEVRSVKMAGGYMVLEKPSLRSKVVKQVTTPEDVNLAAHLDTPDGRFYLSDWSITRRREGKGYFWMFAGQGSPGAEPAPAAAIPDNMDLEKLIMLVKRNPSPESLRELARRAQFTNDSANFARLVELAVALIPQTASLPPDDRIHWMNCFTGGDRAPGAYFDRTGMIEHFDPHTWKNLIKLCDAAWEIKPTTATGCYLACATMELGDFDSAMAVIELTEKLRGNPLSMDDSVEAPVRNWIGQRLRARLFAFRGDVSLAVGAMNNAAKHFVSAGLGHDQDDYSIEFLNEARLFGAHEASILIAKALLENCGVNVKTFSASEGGNGNSILQCSAELADSLLAMGDARSAEALRVMALRVEMEDPRSDATPGFRGWHHPAVKLALAQQKPDLAWKRLLDKDFSWPPDNDARMTSVVSFLLSRDVLSRSNFQLAYDDEEFRDLVLSIARGDEVFGISWDSKNRLIRGAAALRRLIATEPESPAALAFHKAFNVKRSMDGASGNSSSPPLPTNGGKNLEEAMEDLVKSLPDRLMKTRTPSLAEVRAALSPGSVLLDFYKFNKQRGTGTSESRYALLLLTRDTKQVIDCGSAKELEAMVEEWRKISASPTTTSEVDHRLRELSQGLWSMTIGRVEESLAPKLPSTLILCPDAALHFVSFAALLDKESRFVCEKYSVSYVDHVESLLQIPGAAKAPKDWLAVLMGGADYSSSKPLSPLTPDITPGAANRSILPVAQWQQALARPEIRLFPDLPGATLELTQISDILRGSGANVRSITGAEATEEAFANTSRPDVLHIASHGFFIPLPEREMPMPLRDAIIVQRRLQETLIVKGDPMLRGGLALAGASTSFDLWKKGVFPPSDLDGIVTAAEITAMDLKGTYLVALSACDTGVGDIVRGEGILGVKSAFAVTGAKNLMLTLWEIADEETVDLMTAFYRRVISGEKPAVALTAVQREFLQKYRAEKGLAAAVNLAGPFVLTSSEQ